LFTKRNKLRVPDSSKALPGRLEPLSVPELHYVSGNRIKPPFPESCARAYFGMGRFWGAERLFWTLPGVYATAVGYQGGSTPNPTYREVCTGATGHAEVVMAVFDPAAVAYEALLAVFWEGHNPTQGMRQGADIGTQYRSALFVTDSTQKRQAEASRDRYQRVLAAAGFGSVTTQIAPAPDFYYAEEYHQQYLAKNPGGYCGLGGTGVACPTSAFGQAPSGRVPAT